MSWLKDLIALFQLMCDFLFITTIKAIILSKFHTNFIIFLKTLNFKIDEILAVCE